MRPTNLNMLALSFAAIWIVHFAAAGGTAQSFRVPGNSGRHWIDTELQLKQGTLVRLAAKGEVNVGAGWGSYSPEGTQKFADVPGYPAETTFRYGLVARITQSHTDPEDDLREQWAYGERHDYCAARGGHLWLTVNDDRPDDNTGEFAVDVTLRACEAQSTVVRELQSHFRVTVNGFTVNRQTGEQASADHERRAGVPGPYSRNVDGTADEVFVLAEVFVLRRTPGGRFQLVSHSSLRTPVMGDTSGFSDRERAGMASPTGGLRSGESYPTSSPWVRVGQARADRLPMLLWEGELSGAATSQMSVIIIPTIWEWDEAAEGEFARAWRENLYSYMLNSFNRESFPLFDAISVGPILQTFSAGDWFRDRPIANIPIGRSLSQVITGGRVLDAVEYAFNMYELIVTYRTALNAARENFRGVAGVVEVPYADRWITGEGTTTASYTLYVQIERN
jgi:hypothetical protein